MNLGVLARTVARLRPEQIVMRGWAKVAPRLLHRLVGEVAVGPDALRRFVQWSAAVAPWSRAAAVDEAEAALRGEWRYVGITVPARVGGVRSPGAAAPPFFAARREERTLQLPSTFPSRLWEYEFRYRRWLEGLAHIDRSSTREACAAADGQESTGDWEPYVLARRLWSEAVAEGLTGDGSKLSTIARELRVLWMMPERHLLANHLLADRAVVAALSMLLEPRSSSTVHAIEDYIEELDRQIDPDGVHEERSPGYHLIALHDLQRTRAAAEAAEALKVTQRLGAIERRMGKALEFLLHPDGALPMFHDSSAVVRPNASDLGVLPSKQSGGWDLPYSGFCGWRGEVSGAAVHLACDYGDPRPSHQPGHQHAAPFAFELWWDGPVITGCGVSTYEANERRLAERGAGSHACLMVDDREPAEIWSAFRMGRGYEITSRKVVTKAERWEVSGTHDGFPGRPHRRSIFLDAGNGTIEVTDEVTGCGSAKVDFHLPIDGQWFPEPTSREGVQLSRGDDRISIQFRDFETVSIEPAKIHRKFGVPSNASMLIATRRGALPIRTAVRLQLPIR